MVRSRPVVRILNVIAVLVCILAPAVARVTAQRLSAFQADYVVALPDPPTASFHVTARFSHVNQPRLDLSLPIWTPGWYTLEYYAKNVSQLRVADEQGRRLAAPLSRMQTWSVDTADVQTVVVDFDYKADVLGLNQAKITDTFAFFTGTQLFLEPVGHRDAPATVRFVIPTGWGIATALRETTDTRLFRASNYDELVDAPAWLGAYTAYRFDVDGKPHMVVHDKAMTFPQEAVDAYLKSLATMVRTAEAVFGEIPYDKYVFFWLPGTAEGAGGGLEHGNSFVICCGGPTQLKVGEGAAHEFFHLWNVKRIRPAELWPYDYSRPVETPSLWFSEGVTDYYGTLIAYRSGLRTKEEMATSLAFAISTREGSPQRHVVSPSDASMATFRRYGAEPISYYNAGRVLGGLLDLSILHDTGGRRGLDDVMRALYERFYKQGRGFTPADLQATVSSVAGRDYAGFFRQYVAGTDVPPYDAILGYAGLRAHEDVYGVPGILTEPVAEGRVITLVGAVPGLPAVRAGLRKGDVIVAIDGRPVTEFTFYSNGCCILGQYDKTVSFTVRRDSTELHIPMRLDYRPWREQKIEFESDPTPTQTAVRNVWLARR